MDRYWEGFKTPFICFAGFSGVGKTTLLVHMIQRFKKDHIRVGYYKHDAHRFQMDKKGKDTQRGAEAGAGIVTINDPEHCAVIADNPFKKRTITHALEQCDCILIEGYKKSPFDKIVFLDKDGKLPIAADDPGIKAIIHQGVVDDTSFAERGIPLFHRDEADQIYQFVKEHFYNCTRPLLGGVFIGGQSKRMGTPKFSLSYQGSRKPSAWSICSPTSVTRCISPPGRNRISMLFEGLQRCGRINDEHYGLGPVGGLATLMGTHPEKAWLITACDMPFLQEDAIARIVSERDPLRYGTCFLQKGGVGVEPMCAIYEPKFIVPLFEALSRRELSLTRIIKELPFKHVTVTPSDRTHFTNVNTPEEYEVARTQREQEEG